MFLWAHFCDGMRLEDVSGRRRFLSCILGSAIPAVAGLRHSRRFLVAGGSAAPSRAAIPVAEAPTGQFLSQWITYPGHGITLHGFLARPVPHGIGRQFPAFVLVPRSGGLTDSVRSEACRMAGRGCVALAVDLLSRRGGSATFKSGREALAALQSIPGEYLRADILATRRYLESHPCADSAAVVIASASAMGQKLYRGSLAAGQKIFN